MSSTRSLDVSFCRSYFPALESGWVFMENAGGTMGPKQVIDRISHYTTNCQIQPGEGYEPSDHAADLINEGRKTLADLINAGKDEIVVGPSTTSNVYVLSHAIRSILDDGDEIIVTNQDHEANNGAWRRLEATGIVIKEWKMSADTDDLEIEDLKVLLTDKTKLVCFTHCSNIVGLAHDAKEIVRVAHEAGAMTCVDGVAYVPHRRTDVKDLDTDFYLYSPYKILGPHLGVFYGKREVLPRLASQNHYFVPEDDFQRSLCPGGPNHELTAGAGGIAEYFNLVHEHHFPGANMDTVERLNRLFEIFADHERVVGQPIEDFLRSKPNIRLIGQGAPADRQRVGVYSFLVEGRDSRQIPEKLRAHKIGIFADDFYAARCIDALGARPRNGVIRVSLAHYNSPEDVGRLIDNLAKIV